MIDDRDMKCSCILALTGEFTLSASDGQVVSHWVVSQLSVFSSLVSIAGNGSVGFAETGRTPGWQDKGDID